MKAILTSLLCAAALMLAVGCVSDNGKFPTPTANFVPKRAYTVSQDKLWRAALDTLDNNRIAVINSDKVDGMIQTDYVSGPGNIMIPLNISQITRYKYHLNFRGEPDGSIKLNIICTVEDSMSDGKTTSQWRDVTSQNAKLVDSLETWLYEQVEDELKAP